MKYRIFQKGGMILRIREQILAKSNLVFEFSIYLMLFVFVILGFRYQYLLLNYREWMDESETIVTAKMMASGMRLYSEIFNHHGPLTFLLGVLTETFGDFSVIGHRVAIAILQVLAILSIYKSQALKSTIQRIIASVASSVVVLVFLPDVFGHMYKYQTITGIILVVILSQYTIPVILITEKVGPLRVVMGNFLIASLPFLAIIYLPISGLLFFASLTGKNVKVAVIGFFSGLMANLLFLDVYGSFAGYLAFHIYLNAKILPFYTGLQPGMELVINVYKVITSDLTHFFSVIAILPGVMILAQKERAFPWRTLFLVAGLGSLLTRGASFHGMPYFYAILPIIALSLSVIDTSSKTSKQLALVFLLLCILKVSLVSPLDYQKVISAPIPTETEFSKLVATFTNPGDKIIAYSFRNFEYLVSKRLPASGNFFYFPWQAKYNENPQFGIMIDACRQITEAAPKIMLIDKWNVWYRFPWNSYAGCVQNLIDSKYSQIPGKPYYIRKDLVSSISNRF